MWLTVGLMIMTKEQFSLMVKGMKAVYTDPKFIPDKAAFETWYALLADLEYKTANIALQKYMMTNHFPPTPADIRNNIEVPEGMNSNEAWSLVFKAVRNASYHAQEEYDKLPSIVQKAVGSADSLRSMALDANFNEGVEKSHFTRVYDTLQARAKQDSKLPIGLRTENILQIGVEKDGLNS